MTILVCCCRGLVLVKLTGFVVKRAVLLIMVSASKRNKLREQADK